MKQFIIHKNIAIKSNISKITRYFIILCLLTLFNNTLSNIGFDKTNDNLNKQNYKQIFLYNEYKNYILKKLSKIKSNLINSTPNTNNLMYLETNNNTSNNIEMNRKFLVITSINDNTKSNNKNTLFNDDQSIIQKNSYLVKEHDNVKNPRLYVGYLTIFKEISDIRYLKSSTNNIVYDSTLVEEKKYKVVYELKMQLYVYNKENINEKNNFKGSLCLVENEKSITECNEEKGLEGLALILLISDEKGVKITNDNTSATIRAVICIENIVSKETIKYHKYPYFMVNKDDFDDIQKYRIRNDKLLIDNAYAEIEYSGIIEFLKNYYWLVLFMSVYSGILFVLFIIWIIYIFYYNKKNTILLTRYYSTLPYLVVILSLGTIYSIRNNLNSLESHNKNIIINLITELVCKLVGVVFKTFYWILVLLISHVSFINILINYIVYYISNRDFLYLIIKTANTFFIYLLWFI